MIEPRSAHPFAWTSRPWGRALQSERLNEIAAHFFTTRDLVLRGPASGDGWQKLGADIGVPPSRLARPKQVHGTAVFVVRRGDIQHGVGTHFSRHTPGNPGIEGQDGRPRADIIMTDDSTVALAVQVADCVPLLLADARTGAVAAVHAGWRGTAAGVCGHAVAAMQSAFGSRPADLVAAIGPAIGLCCYQVGADVLAAFRKAGFSNEDLSDWFREDKTADAERAGAARGNADPKYRLDVARANADQLVAAGVDPGNIAACGLCTACDPGLFPSYRRDGAGTGRLAGVIKGR